jgi:hypothetical protein
VSEPNAEPTPEPEQPAEATGEPVTPSEPEPEPEPTPEEEEPEEPAEPPVEATPEPQAGPTPEELDKRRTKGQQAFGRYSRSLEGVYEDEFEELYECPLCPSVHKGYVNIHDAGRVPDEYARAVMKFLGYTPEVEYKQSPAHRGCDICGGHGKVLTGGKVPGKERTTCPNCQGHGYLPPPSGPLNGPASTEEGRAAAAEVLADFESQEVDNFGEPRILPDGRENPNYGKWPQYKVPVEPWGVTAGLTAQDAPAPA